MANQIHFTRETALMTLRTAALTAVAAFGLAACGSDNTTSNPSGNTYVRLINSVYIDSTVPDVVSIDSVTDPVHPDTVFTTPQYVAAPIDMLFDSAAAAPSFISAAPNSVNDLSGGTGPKPANLDAGYHALSVGVHSFVARVSGLTPAGPSFFTTGSNTQYLPKQYLTNTTYYTFVLAGTTPKQPKSGSPVLNGQYDFGYGFPLLVDDPFTPPSITVNGTTTLQARFRFINAATFPSQGYMQAYISTTPIDNSNVGSLVSVASTGQNSGSGYVNVTAGTYYVGLVINGTLVYTGSLPFAAGEVRTLVLQNSTSAIPDPNALTSADYKLTSVKDNQY